MASTVRTFAPSYPRLLSGRCYGHHGAPAPVPATVCQCRREGCARQACRNVVTVADAPGQCRQCRLGAHEVAF